MNFGLEFRDLGTVHPIWVLYALPVPTLAVRGRRCDREISAPPFPPAQFEIGCAAGELPRAQYLEGAQAK